MNKLIALALAVGSMAAPLRAADPHVTASSSSIVGMWRLVAASPIAPSDVDPHGMVNQKLYFSKDGRIFLLRPEEKLTADIPSAAYEFDGKTRKVTLPDGKVRNDPAQITGDTLAVTMPDGQQLTYRRIPGEHADEQTFAPISVEVVATGKTIAEPKYDDADHSQQPLAERIRGVWEVVRYAKLSGDVPPHGFPNEKYVIDAKQIAIVPPDAKTTDRRLPYELANDAMLVATGQAPATWSVSFNPWQQLVLTREDAEVTLRLVQKSTDSVPVLPTKVALVE